MTIHEMRIALGDTQSEFAERYNIPFRTIQNWEAGVRKPPEYVAALLESRIQSDLFNRKTSFKFGAEQKRICYAIYICILTERKPLANFWRQRYC